MLGIGFFAASASGGGGGAAYELISSTVLGSSQSSVTFSSIVGTYKHLQIRMAARSDQAGFAANYSWLRLNGQTANYFRHALEGNGSSASSYSATGNQAIINSYIPAAAAATSIFGASIIDIANYANTTTYKTVRALGGVQAGDKFVGLYSGSIANTAAITSIELSTIGYNWVTGSRFSLYGIKG
jgi:hypothetical protein